MGEPLVSNRQTHAKLRNRLPLRDLILGAVGGIAGASLGYFLFHVLARQGFYALILPGALTGIGCGILSRCRSTVLGIVCSVIGALAGIITEWQFAPFTQEGSLQYFVMHLHQLRPFTQLLIVLGALLAFWFGMGRTGGAWHRPTAEKSHF